MLLKSQIPERDYDITKLQSNKSHHNALWDAKRTQKEHFTVESLISNGSFDNAQKYLESKALSEPSLTPLDLVPKLEGWRHVFEYVYILRPIMYLLCLRRWGKMSYKPWILSIFTELICYSNHYDDKSFKLKSSLSVLEKEEVKRRRFHFLYYLLRDPFYSQYTK